MVDVSDLCFGGMVFGLILMVIVDVVLYVVVLGEIGIVLLVVIISLIINFLWCFVVDCWVVVECCLMKVGKILVMGEVLLFFEGDVELVVYVVGIYLILLVYCC